MRGWGGGCSEETIQVERLSSESHYEENLNSSGVSPWKGVGTGEEGQLEGWLRGGKNSLCLVDSSSAQETKFLYILIIKLKCKET